MSRYDDWHNTFYGDPPAANPVMETMAKHLQKYVKGMVSEQRPTFDIYTLSRVWNVRYRHNGEEKSLKLTCHEGLCSSCHAKGLFWKSNPEVEILWVEPLAEQRPRYIATTNPAPDNWVRNRFMMHQEPDIDPDQAYMWGRPAKVIHRRIIFLMGPTCSGKSSVIDYMLTKPDVGAVQVGKLFRAKYPPEFFQGHDNPVHTQEEAMKMMMEGIHHERITNNRNTIVVDGQPRTPDQLQRCLDAARHFGAVPTFVLLYCPQDIRRQRAESTRTGSTLALAMDRITNDMITGYEVLVAMAEQCIQPIVYRTDLYSAEFIGAQLV